MAFDGMTQAQERFDTRAEVRRDASAVALAQVDGTARRPLSVPVPAAPHTSPPTIGTPGNMNASQAAAASTARAAGALRKVGEAAPPTRRIVVALDRLPFVGLRGDGQKSYWRMEGLQDGESQKLRARTFAAWYLVYAETNGPEAAAWLLDRIEREMPSRYPQVDRMFLEEVTRLG